jgi:hypothetical protein
VSASEDSGAGDRRLIRWTEITNKALKTAGDRLDERVNEYKQT